MAAQCMISIQLTSLKAQSFIKMKKCVVKEIPSQTEEEHKTLCLIAARKAQAKSVWSPMS